MHNNPYGLPFSCKITFHKPMENLDTQTEDVASYNEDDLFMQHVIKDDHELMYLDTCLNEICQPQNESGS